MPDAGTALEPQEVPPGLARATFAGGCFWCTEAVFQQLRGVHAVVSGYTGGSVEAPTYRAICTGTTGHAEAIQITFDPASVSYEALLEVFFATHDPTTRHRQGNDVGTQYRSAIFVHNEEQRQVATEFIRKLNESGRFGRPIVTEINAFNGFYRAEAYHQNYFRTNPTQGYCQVIIAPKVQKTRQAFADRLGDDGMLKEAKPGR
jgi:methionine-S-sulfoxide reductase